MPDFKKPVGKHSACFSLITECFKEDCRNCTALGSCIQETRLVDFKNDKEKARYFKKRRLILEVLKDKKLLFDLAEGLNQVAGELKVNGRK